MAGSRHSEVERKYELGAGVELPDLAGVGSVACARAPEDERLDAVYFDTADLVLAQHATVVRRRTGGDDEGWHLKLPAGRDERTELRVPLEGAVQTVPAALEAVVRGLVRGRRLVAVAHLATHRIRRPLLDADGVVLAQLCDDRVDAERLVGDPLTLAWRECEIELDHGDRVLLDLLGKEIATVGGAPASYPSKLARALGDRCPTAPSTPSSEALRRGTAKALVTAHLERHLGGLLEQDARMRAGERSAVHRMRIQARRLRSTLTTYAPLFVAGSVDPLREELRWLGQVLGRARDAQVLHERLSALAAREPVELVSARVAQRIDQGLEGAHRAGLEEGLAALDSDSYLRLLDSLEGLTKDPPFRERADEPAAEVVPLLLERDAERLDRAVRAVAGTTAGHERDAALHEARKKAKRLRYALESAEPIYGSRAKHAVKEVAHIQDVLGRRQDSVVARALLEEYAAQAHREGDDTFGFGRLHAIEERHGDEREAEFLELWAGARPTRKLRRRLEK